MSLLKFTIVVALVGFAAAGPFDKFGTGITADKITKIVTSRFHKSIDFNNPKEADGFKKAIAAAFFNFDDDEIDGSFKETINVDVTMKLTQEQRGVKTDTGVKSLTDGTVDVSLLQSNKSGKFAETIGVDAALTTNIKINDATVKNVLTGKVNVKLQELDRVADGRKIDLVADGVFGFDLDSDDLHFSYKATAKDDVTATVLIHDEDDAEKRFVTVTVGIKTSATLDMTVGPAPTESFTSSTTGEFNTVVKRAN